MHRDIKPGNVMLTRAGTIKVMDFGIARAVADASATMTNTAAVIGTAQYLSPEQAKGEKVDARSDLYSTGCLLYELLTSQPPFTGDSPVAVAYQHVRENPKPPSQVDPAVTPAMDAIVLKALAKNPDNRYQNAAEMREDIERCIEGRPVSAPPVMKETPPPRAAVRAAGGPPTERDPRGHRDARAARPDAGSASSCSSWPSSPWPSIGSIVGKNVLGSSKEKVTVPPLLGLTQKAAEDLLKAKSLAGHHHDEERRLRPRGAGHLPEPVGQRDRDPGRHGRDRGLARRGEVDGARADRVLLVTTRRPSSRRPG